MRALMSYLPDNYTASPEMRALQEAIQPETDAAWNGRNDLLLQLDPRTAGAWGLSLWEAAFGIVPDPARDLEFRRTRVLAMIRGSGTVTPAHIREVAESFSNGTVQVNEFPRENRIEIEFTGTLGIPPNIEDLQAVLKMIIPAHLAWSFVIHYRTHSQLTGYTHGQLAAYTHNTIREEDMNGN